MTTRNRLFILALLLFLSIPPVASQAMEEAVFISIIDGDSLMVETGGSIREVRLIGVDAPEWGQEYSTEAKTFSLKFCYGGTLKLEYDAVRKDRYGRTLAYVYNGGKMLNEELAAAGLALAVTYKPNTRHQARLARAQALAEKQRQGFWLYGGLKMTPRQWRKQHPRK